MPVTAPPKEISDLRALFATYRIIGKQTTQTKNRIHSLLKMFPACLRNAPKVESSNGKTINKSTNEAGRKLSITLLPQVLNHFRDSNEKRTGWYGRLNVYKKKGIIRMALCRRVFTEIYPMLKKGEYHWHHNPRLHEKKMSGYRSFLRRRE